MLAFYVFVSHRAKWHIMKYRLWPSGYRCEQHMKAARKLGGYSIIHTGHSLKAVVLHNMRYKETFKIKYT